MHFLSHACTLMVMKVVCSHTIKLTLFYEFILFFYSIMYELRTQLLGRFVEFKLISIRIIDLFNCNVAHGKRSNNPPREIAADRWALFKGPERVSFCLID